MGRFPPSKMLGPLHVEDHEVPGIHGGAGKVQDFAAGFSDYGCETTPDSLQLYKPQLKH